MTRCKICNSPGDIGNWDHKSKNLNFGLLGKYSMEIWVYEKGKLQVDITDDVRDELFSCDFKIKYCPFCGRKLSK
jgi:hypothetical protein